jgi:hypothetical protein
MVHGFHPEIKIPVTEGSRASTPGTPDTTAHGVTPRKPDLFVESPSTSRASSRIDEDNEFAAHYRVANEDQLKKFKATFPEDMKIIDDYGETPATFLSDQGDGRCMLERAVSDGNPVGAAMMYRQMGSELKDKAVGELYKGLVNCPNKAQYLASVSAIGGQKLKNKVEALDLFNQWNAGPGLGGWHLEERNQIIAKLDANHKLREAFDDLNKVKPPKR